MGRPLQQEGAFRCEPTCKGLQSSLRASNIARIHFGHFFLARSLKHSVSMCTVFDCIVYSVLYMLQCSCNQLGTSTVSQFNSVRSHSARFYHRLSVSPYRYHRITVSVYHCISSSLLAAVVCREQMVNMDHIHTMMLQIHQLEPSSERSSRNTIWWWRVVAKGRHAAMPYMAPL